jgi:hypothetical protein
MSGNIISIEPIQERIYFVRGQKVMLDRHLAELYETETRVLMQAVKRNHERFPEDFMFELTREEITRISQIVTSLKFSKNVFAFTEQGIAMLSSVLRSKRAIRINIAIMRAFVKLREVLARHRELADRLAELERRMDKKDQEIIALFEAIRQLVAPPQPPKPKIGFLS